MPILTTDRHFYTQEMTTFQKKKRKYPLFLIDRSQNETYPYVYIDCMNDQYSFVAKMFTVSREYMQKCKGENFKYFAPIKEGAIAFEIIDHRHDKDIEDPAVISKINKLANKAFKKARYNEVKKTPGNDLGIDNQILLMEETITNTENNFSNLVEKLGDEERANYLVDLSRATLQTLKKAKSWDGEE